MSRPVPALVVSGSLGSERPPELIGRVVLIERGTAAEVCHL